MEKIKLDYKFYISLQKEIRDIISFDKFRHLETETFKCKFYKKFINKLCILKGFKSNYSDITLDGIIFISEILDLDPYQFGKRIKNCFKDLENGNIKRNQ